MAAASNRVDGVHISSAPEYIDPLPAPDPLGPTRGRSCDPVMLLREAEKHPEVSVRVAILLVEALPHISEVDMGPACYYLQLCTASICKTYPGEIDVAYHILAGLFQSRSPRCIHALRELEGVCPELAVRIGFVFTCMTMPNNTNVCLFPSMPDAENFWSVRPKRTRKSHGRMTRSTSP